MMYPRLLRDDGALEIFGPENVIGTFIWEKRRSRENRKSFSVNHDYILCVARNRPVFELTRGLLPLTEEARERYGNPDNDSRGVWQSVAITAQAGHGTKNQFYTIVTPSGRRLDPPSGNCWRFTRERLNALIEDGRIWFGKDGGNVPRQKMFLAEQDEGLTPQTIWTAEEVGTTDSAKRSLNDIFGGASVFETPKSVELIRRIIDIAAGKDGLIVDFFAGVGVTGEATIRANAADGGSRRYILVQLPEPIDPEKPEAGPAIAFCREAKIPATLTALAQERMRRVAREVSKADSLDKRGDCGQRVFSLAASNIRSWNPRPDDLGDLLTRSADNILDGRTEDDLLFEFIIKLGLELDNAGRDARRSPARPCMPSGPVCSWRAWCPSSRRRTSRRLASGSSNWHRALAPDRARRSIVFRDSAFPDDVAKTNLTAILEQAGIKNVRSL
jgi:adenine-specific DNA-methyltransferase